MGLLESSALPAAGQHPAQQDSLHTQGQQVPTGHLWSSTVYSTVIITNKRKILHQVSGKLLALSLYKCVSQGVYKPISSLKKSQ